MELSMPKMVWLLLPWRLCSLTLAQEMAAQQKLYLGMKMKTIAGPQLTLKQIPALLTVMEGAVLNILPISTSSKKKVFPSPSQGKLKRERLQLLATLPLRSEEHTSELQSRENLVCRLLLEKKNDD